MATKYTYSISGDTKNGVVDSLRLENEIRTSVIITALDYINTDGDELDVWFKTTLSSGDKIILDGIVATHTGEKWDTDVKKTLDDKMWIHESSRPMGMVTYFTSEGDDITDPTKLGGGTKIKIIHNIGDDIEQDINIDFNIKENKTYIHEGYLIWKGCEFDAVSLEVVPTLTSYTSGSSTNFNLYGGYLIIPAAGDGTITVQVQDMKLIESPVSRDTGIRKTAYWNADYSTTTHEFSNITAAPNGDGLYNMFTVEVTMAKFVNKALLLDTGFLMLQSADVEEIGHGMRLKFHAHTNGGADHDWQTAIILTLNRDHIQ